MYFSNIEELIFKASSGQGYEAKFSIVCNFCEDLDKEELESQLKVLQALFKRKWSL